MMEMVQGQEAHETKRMLWGTHIAHIARADMTVNTTVQVACSETVFNPIVKVTSADALMSAMLIRNPTAKIPSTHGPPSTRP
jgi:hypothetical protein